jgi:hypothetical protein
MTTTTARNPDNRWMRSPNDRRPAIPITGNGRELSITCNGSKNIIRIPPTRAPHRLGPITAATTCAPNAAPLQYILNKITPRLVFDMFIFICEQPEAKMLLYRGLLWSK